MQKLNVLFIILLSICLGFCLQINVLSAQNKIDSVKSKIARNAVFAQYGEIGLSINYDYTFARINSHKLAIRVGTCPFFISKGIFPSGFDLQYFYGKQHNIGISIGITYANGIDDISTASNNDGRFAALFFYSRINYRYQKPKGRVFIQCGIFVQHQIAMLYSYKDSRNPWYYPMNSLLPSIGLGYSF
jgi:hypothetical protein